MKVIEGKHEKFLLISKSMSITQEQKKSKIKLDLLFNALYI